MWLVSLGLKLIYYGPKGDILEYWETHIYIYILLSYYILSKDKGL